MSEKLLNDVTPKKRRRNKALKYREMYLLPRFVVEEDGSKRKLEAGEFDPNSKLYPLTTPISEMSDFGTLGTGGHGPLCLVAAVEAGRCAPPYRKAAKLSSTSFLSVRTLWPLLLTPTPSAHARQPNACLFACLRTGIGIGMYFGTTFWFGVMMIVCAALQFPTANYFNSTDYDATNGVTGVYGSGEGYRSIKTWGSAACLDEKRVCLDPTCNTYAGEFHYPSQDQPRFSPSYDPVAENFRSELLEIFDDDTSHPNAGELGYELSNYNTKVVGNTDKMTVGKRQCHLLYYFGITDFAMIVWVCGVLGFLAYYQNKEAEELDEAEQTAQDYSVIVEDPNPEVINPDEWKKFFEQHGAVFMVTVCLNNGKMLKLFKEKRRLEYQMHLEAIEEAKFSKAKRRASLNEPGFLDSLRMNQSSKSYFKQAMELLGESQPPPPCKRNRAERGAGALARGPGVLRRRQQRSNCSIHKFSADVCCCRHQPNPLHL